MADNSQTATTLLAYQVDQSSVQTVVLANTKIIDSLNTVVTSAQSGAEQLAAMGVSLADVSVGGDAINTSLVAPLDAADASIKNIIHDIGDLGRDIEAIPEPDLSAFGVDDSGGGGGGGASPFASRRGLSALGSLAGGSPGLSDAARLVSVGAAFGPVGIAAGIAAIGLKAISDSEQAVIASSKEFVANFEQVNDVVVKGASKNDLQKNIDDINKRNEGLAKERDLLADLAKQGADVQKAIDAGTTTGDYGTARLRTINDSIQELTGDAALDFHSIGVSVDQLTADINKGKGTAEAFRIEMQNGSTAAADAAEQQKELAKFFKLGAEAGNLLKDAVGALAQKAEQARQAIDAQNTLVNNNYLDLVSSEGRTRDAISTDIQAITDLRTAATAKEADITADNSAKIADIEQQGADKRAEIAQTAADNIAKIERDAGRSEFSAKANRDAVAFSQAQIKEKDALDDEKKADTKSLAQEMTAETKQLATQQTAYNKQIQQTETALSTQTQIQQHKLLQDQTDLINITNAELTISQNGGIGVVSAHEYMMQGIKSVVLDYGVQIVAGLSNIFSSFQPLPSASNGGSQGAVNAAQVHAIVRNQLTGYLGLNNPGGNRLS